MFRVQVTQTAMELLPLVCVSLLTWSGTTFAAENVTLQLFVEKGRDVILPCSLKTKEDITSKKFEWKKDDKQQVFLYDAGNYSNNVLDGQDQQFKGRVEHFPDKLNSSDASITIRNTKVDDSGRYTCNFTDFQPEGIFHIQLDVYEATVITVEEGNNGTLPCPLSTKENITSEKFEWKKDDKQQVFLYNAGNHSNNDFRGQDQQFIQRVEHSPDELESGNASITIRNMKVADSGLYTCEFPNLQPRQISYIQLIVYKPTVIRVEEGADAILPCSLSTNEDITSEKFEWKQNNQLVFLYNASGQAIQFKPRVEHYTDKLKSGNASIMIRITMMNQGGLYTCEFPDLKPSQITYIQLVVGPKVFTVEEGNDITLPCSLSKVRDITREKFEWKKDGQQRVFLYNDGSHPGNGQDEQFKERVKYIPDKLKLGNANIIIRNMKMADSGHYSCEFTEEKYYIKIGVYGKPQPSVWILAQTTYEALLQCEVQGAFPKPELHWEDSAGKKLPAEEPVVTESEGLYNITLNITVTMTSSYRCVMKQGEVKRETEAETFVYIHGASPWPSVRMLDQTKYKALLQCEVQGAFPKPELRWEDSEKILLTEKPIVTKDSKDFYGITLNITVNKTNTYRCVMTQNGISHDVETFVYIPGVNIFFILFIVAIALLAALVCGYAINRYRKQRTGGGHIPQMETMYMNSTNGETTT